MSLGKIIFLIFLLKKNYCGYKLEPPHRGSSYEYPQSMFWNKNNPFINPVLQHKNGVNGVHTSSTCYPCYPDECYVSIWGSMSFSFKAKLILVKGHFKGSI